MATNVNSVQTGMQKLADGLKSNPPAGATALVIDGQSVAMADVVAQVLAWVVIYQAASDAARAYKRAIAARTAIEGTALPRFAKIGDVVKSMIGRTSPDLALYGLKADKAPRVLTAEEKAAAARLRNATRAARHTMGSRQKESVHGEATAPAATDPAATTAPTAATAPAAATTT